MGRFHFGCLWLVHLMKFLCWFLLGDLCTDKSGILKSHIIIAFDLFAILRPVTFPLGSWVSKCSVFLRLGRDVYSVEAGVSCFLIFYAALKQNGETSEVFQNHRFSSFLSFRASTLCWPHSALQPVG